MRTPVQTYLETLHSRFTELRGGAVADYIPELSQADPEWFGICLATADGRLYEVGDTRQQFTIQSMSKPFTYGLALHERGRQAVGETVGVEPSGDAFNSISLEPVTGRPLNPMINAGAIATASLIGGESVDERFERILATYSRYAGRRLTLDEQTFSSERDTGHRNRAIGHMLRTFEIVHEAPDAALEVYFRQCSVSVDCRDVALMAATLANGGEHPVSGERALEPEYVERVLSVMTTCGMYDGSGRWVDEVGLPAKSGVAGGILAVLPGQFGLCVFSPRLDAQGNSVRGVAVCRELTAELELHSLRVARASLGAVRSFYDVAHVPSRRRRPEAQRAVLARVGGRACVWSLQGDILFAGSEAVLRAVGDCADGLDIAVLDLIGVTGISDPAVRMLSELGEACAAEGKELLLVDRRPGARFDTVDAALEYCEERLLAEYGDGVPGVPRVTLSDHALCRGLDAAQLTTLDQLLGARRYPPGETIFRAEDAAAEIFLLMEGEVSIEAISPDGTGRRLVTMLAGSIFGELAVLGEATRTASVIAREDVVVRVLGAADFAGLEETAPRLQARMLRNMLTSAYDSVARMTREVATLRPS